MEIRHVLEAGYVPVKYENYCVVSYEVDPDLEVFSINMSNGRTCHISTHIPTTKVPQLQFQLHVGLDEEIVNGILISQVAHVRKALVQYPADDREQLHQDAVAEMQKEMQLRFR